MKLLRISAWDFKGCADNYTIDFVAKTKKTEEDKEYELQEIASNLFVYNTMAIVGKNASGKTTSAELLYLGLCILSYFRVYAVGLPFQCNDTKIELIFYHKGYIYKYCATLNTVRRNESTLIEFSNEVIYSHKYAKSMPKKLFDFSADSVCEYTGDLPSDVSRVFFVLKDVQSNCLFYDWHDETKESLDGFFKDIADQKVDSQLLKSILKLLDDNVDDIVLIGDKEYKLTYKGVSTNLSTVQLFNRLSIGTIKGLMLYVSAIGCLRDGASIVIDEIENHFHKTLVENLISLFKDKRVNKYNSTLIFTTHYNELLDMFNRKDNIYICKSENELKIYNMALDYKEVRSELVKSKAFYNNVFGTAVNYDYLMALKKELLKA